LNDSNRIDSAGRGYGDPHVHKEGRGKDGAFKLERGVQRQDQGNRRAAQEAGDDDQRAQLESILGRLVTYAATHFGNEERLLQTHGFPGFAEHKEKHEKMTAKVLALQQEYRHGKMTLSIEVMNFLKNWLDKHILGTDMNYSEFLAGRGVK
jgi:hemerythrin-like metal-binding protein